MTSRIRHLVKGWRTWRTFALNAIRNKFKGDFPVPPDDRRFELLRIRLGIASDVDNKVMMDDMVLDASHNDEDGNDNVDDFERGDESGGLFDDPGARSGTHSGYVDDYSR